MTLQTYSDLVEESKVWIDFEDIEARIPALIRLTESQFNRRLRVRELEKRVTYAITSAESDLPTDFVEMISLYNTDTGVKMEYQSVDDLEARESRTGAASKFSIAGNQLLFWPTPTEATNIAMRYRAEVPPLSSSAPVNDVLQRYPDIYLYGLLMNASIFLHEEEDTAIWRPLYEVAIEDANTQNEKLVKQNYRMRPSGAPV